MKVPAFVLVALAALCLAPSAIAQEELQPPSSSTVESASAATQAPEGFAMPHWSSSFATTSGISHTASPLAPEAAPTHKFFDRQQFLGLYAHSGMRALDTVKTCRELSHGGVEDWIPSQSCGVIAVWQAGSVGLALGVGWMFHRHGHHRLERITPWVATGLSAAGWTKSVFNIR